MERIHFLSLSSFKMKCLLFLLSCGFLCELGTPFIVRSKAIIQQQPKMSHSLSRKVLFSSPDDESSSTTIETTLAAKASAQVSMEPEGTSFPIDLPSPILLSISMILAIIGTGTYSVLTQVVNKVASRSRNKR